MLARHKPSSNNPSTTNAAATNSNIFDKPLTICSGIRAEGGIDASSLLDGVRARMRMAMAIAVKLVTLSAPHCATKVATYGFAQLKLRPNEVPTDIGRARL